MIIELTLQLGLVLLAAPLLLTLAKKTKAFWQSRQGPRLLQGYYDLVKLLRKDILLSEHATWIFVAAPTIILACYLTASTLVPIARPTAPLGFVGDLFLLVYLLATARFFMALGGLDPASPFGGLGSSREVTFAALIEPGLLVSFLTLVAVSGTTSLDAMSAPLHAGILAVPPTLALALAALLVLIVAELNRVPVDNPATHLELTMVHEAMVLEHTGPNLAFIELANGVKHAVLLAIVATVFVPWNPADPTTLLGGLAWSFVTLAKMALLMVLIATSESWMAKWRVFRVPELTTIAFLLAFLAALGSVLAYGGT
ncbi:MAG: NADH-quinone oxidoreductase subunit H [Candidatus Thermoplasmatota archaeon]